jgi:nicotinamidase-related amidase
MLADAAGSLLAVIDMQERLAAAMDPSILRGVVKNTGILLQSAGRLGIPVVISEQYPKGLGPTAAEVLNMLPPANVRIEKTRFSCACEEGLVQAVQSAGRRQVIVAGMEAHVCVLQSALELRASGHEVFVVADACCSRSAENHANAMHRLRAAGVVVTNTESTVFEWLRDARHEHFKALSALLR